MAEVTMPEVDRAAAGRAAVAARRARAAVKAAVHKRERRALDVAQTAWADPSSAEGTLRVRELLTSIPGIGPTRVARIMTELGIAESKRVGGLGTRQRTKLRNWLMAREGAPARPESRLVVLAGPTAVGKGTVAGHIREHYPEVHLSISATTRAPRPGEIDGKHYYFVSDEEFDRMIEAGEFLEWATVHNQSRYGTPRPPIEAAIREGRSVLLEIDLQGARAVKKSMPEALLVFLLPPSWDELVRRLTGRGTESPEEQARRLETAKVELAAQDEFDVKIVNHEVSRAAQEVVELLAVPGTDSARTRI